MIDHFCGPVDTREFVAQFCQQDGKETSAGADIEDLQRLIFGQVLL